MTNIKEGEALFAVGKIKEAERCFLNIVRDFPENTEALNNLGVIYHALGNIGKAENYFLRALSIREDHSDSLLNLAEMYKNAGHWEQAATQYERYLRIDNNNCNAFSQLVMVYLEMRDIEKARMVMMKRNEINQTENVSGTNYCEIQIDGSAKSRGTMWGERVRRHAMHALNYLSGSILDVGCNDGYAMEVFRDAGRVVFGIEINPVRVIEALLHGLQVVCLDVNRLHLIKGSLRFDNAFFSHALEHTLDPARVLRQLSRIVRHGMYIVVPKEGRIPEENPSHYSIFPSQDAMLTIIPSGWRIVEMWEQHDIEPEIIAVLANNR